MKLNTKTKLFTTIFVLLLTSASVTATEYVVQSGDTLESIAAFLNKTPEQISYVNQLEDADAIETGQVLHYVSSADISFAEQQLKDLYVPGALGAHAGDKAHLLQVKVNYLKSENIMYSSNPNGINAIEVLNLAQDKRLIMNLESDFTRQKLVIQTTNAFSGQSSPQTIKSIAGVTNDNLPPPAPQDSSLRKNCVDGPWWKLYKPVCS